MTRGLVVMGVSGSGKSTLGRALAKRLGRQFVEGDDLHPPANIAKMAAGIPLDDYDRAPFLANVAEALASAGPPGAVAACSALKRRYRDAIRERVPDIAFILPRLDRATLEARMQGRTDHFMPPAMLDSQLASFEPPGRDECVVYVDGNQPVGIQVDQAVAQLDHHAPD